MNRVFQYHGAEHKTVFNFEAREALKSTTLGNFPPFIRAAEPAFCSLS